MKETSSPNTRVTMGADGKYRWVYAVHLMKDPTIFLMVWKILFLIFLAIFTVTSVADAVHWGVGKVMENLPVMGYLLLGLTAVTALGYLLYAAIMGGQYAVEFEMDENGVYHRQIEAQAQKAKKLARATMAAGAVSGRLTTVGVGMNAARTEMYSAFSKVRKVKAYPHRHLIRVNGRLEHNQVYADKEDFAFVQEYILSHCDHIKK